MVGGFIRFAVRSALLTLATNFILRKLEKSTPGR